MTRPATWLWRTYAFVLALAVAASLFLIPISPSRPLAVLDGAASIVCVGGVFAFAFRHRLGAPRFWRIWMPSMIAWDVLYALGPLHLALGSPWGDDPALHAWIGLASLVAGAPLVVPAYVALYLHGYRSERRCEPAAARANPV